MRIAFAQSSCLLVALAAASLPLVAAEPSGEVIYRKQCARCHGTEGEGTKEVPQPLVGDKSIPQLTKLIDRSMPEDEPTAVVGEEARLVAAYLHDRFYSVDAQARRNPPRIAFSRLTVGQYRQALADILAGFREPPKLDGPPGLKGEYFNSRRLRENKLIDRVDPELQFDFGTAGPPVAEEQGKFNDNQFSIRWQGAVLAPETGVYEFIVRTEHAFQLWVNEQRTPLLDLFVKSGTDTEFRASIFLLAGRYYPLRLEFFKNRQLGVDMKKAIPPSKASIALLWKRPRREAEVLPARHLSPGRASTVAVFETPFPPDDRSLGWERGTAISREWDAATTDAALEVAGYVVERLPELAGVANDARERAPRLREFCQRFAERAFRRPLSEEERGFFVDRQFAEAQDVDLAVKRSVLLTLKSPRFLYPDAAAGDDRVAVATRLALALWDSFPDAELLRAAAEGKLATRAELAAQAERMLGDPRARVKLREFLLTWLKLDQPHEMVKDAARFPGFDAAVISDLRTSLELFLDDVVWSETSDFRQLLLADETYLNGRLAEYYGAADVPGPGFAKVRWEPEQRAGVLTHPFVLAALAYPAESSPIHRGVFVGRGLLGITLRPPPDAFTPLPADQHPELTTRERITLQTSPAACANCHTVMNPLGFALEKFDAVGRFRDQERGKPIDDHGLYETRSGETAKFAGSRALAAFLADSEEVHAAFVQQMFHHLAKQPVRAFGLQKPAELRQYFVEHQFNVRKLAVEIAVTAALPPGAPPAP